MLVGYSISYYVNYVKMDFMCGVMPLIDKHILISEKGLLYLCLNFPPFYDDDEAESGIRSLENEIMNTDSIHNVELLL